MKYVSSHWYEAVIEKFGTAENFIDQLCEMQGLTKEDSVSVTSNIDNTVRDKRLMVFTSLLLTLNFVGHARVDQCYGLFVEFEEQYPLIDGYTRTGKAVDHTNMKMFIKLYKEKYYE